MGISEISFPLLLLLLMPRVSRCRPVAVSGYGYGSVLVPPPSSCPVCLRTIFHFIAPLHMAVNWLRDQGVGAGSRRCGQLSYSCSFFEDDARPHIDFSAHCACLHTNILRTCYRSLSDCLQPGLPGCLPAVSTRCWLPSPVTRTHVNCICAQSTLSTHCAHPSAFATASAFASACILLDFICRGNCLRCSVALASTSFLPKTSTHPALPSPLSGSPLEFLLLFCNLSAKWQPFLRCSFACGRTFALLCVPPPLPAQRSAASPVADI